MDRFREPLRFSAFWALGASFATALIDALARALCLPPHWREPHILRCRPGGLLMAIPPALLDTGITTILVFPLALLVGALCWGAYRLAEDRLASSGAAVAAALVGYLLWVAAVERMEPGYLDASVSAYAVAIGAIAGAWLSITSRRARAT